MLQRLPLRQSLHLAIPLIFANISLPLLGLVDTAVVGRLPEPYYLGAVALGAAAMNIILWVFSFLRMATGGLTAQAHGAEQRSEIKDIFARASLLAALIGFIILLMKPWALIFADTVFAPEGSLKQAMSDYLEIRLYGAPAILINHAIIGWFLGQQNARVPMLIVISANMLNALLDVILVFGFGFGVEGVAIATLIAEHVALLIGVICVYRRWSSISDASLVWRNIVNSQRLQRFLLLSRDIFLRTAMLQIGFLMFTSLSVRQGDIVLAVNAILLNFIALQAHGLDGFADAAEAMSGKAVGRRRVDELQAAVKAALVNAVLLASALSLIFWIFGGHFVDLMTTLETVRSEADTYLFYIALMPLISILAFVFDGVFFGATRGREMRNAMICALIGYVAAALLLERLLGNHGLWLALLTFLALRGLILVMIYWRADRGAGFVRS